MEKFFTAVQNMFKVPELRKRIFFTLGMLAVYRLGAHVTAPGINKPRLEQVWGEVAGTLLERATPPAEIAAAVRFILDAPSMTGQMIALDAGQHLAWSPPREHNP